MGKPIDEDRPDNSTSKVVMFKNTRRVIKIPPNFQTGTENYPIEVPGLPSMAITFSPPDHKLILSKNLNPYALLRIENEVDFDKLSKSNMTDKNLSFIQTIPDFIFSQKTLHYALEMYHGCYDTDNIMSKCLELNDYQAVSKISLLDGRYCDSLAFQLSGFKKYMESFVLDLDSIFLNKESYDNVKEKDQDFVEFVVKNIQDFSDKNYNSPRFNNSPEHDLSSSSSLDSIRQWGDDVEHQGGCESPCEVGGDVKQGVTNYVHSLKSDDSSPPISSVSQLVSQTKIRKQNTEEFIEFEVKDEKTKEIIETASYLIEFYIKKIYVSENHILMQNVLMKCIEFWLGNNLPVPILENVLLKNMDKYFYPLSILLFCKNFNNETEFDDFVKDDKKDSVGFLKEFSTKFCLQLCSMVLENVNKA